MTELLSCPFCGSENVETSYKDTFSGDFRRGVYCADCCGGIYPYYKTEPEAIAAWNARAEQTCKMRADGAHCMNGVEFYECCSCGEYACIPTVMGKSEPPNYCPNCGAKVVGE